MQKIQTYRRSIRYLMSQMRGHRMQISLNLLTGILLVALDLAFVWATKVVIDIATHPVQTASSNIATYLSLPEALGLLAFFMLLRIAIVVGNRWIKATLGVKAQNSMRAHLLTRLLQADWQQLRAYHTGNLTNRLEQDVTDVVNFITEHVASFIVTLVQLVGSFLFLFYLEPRLATIIIVLFPIFLLSAKLYVKRMRLLTHQAREQESQVQSLIQETLRHVVLIKTLQRITHFRHQLSGLQAQLHRTILHRTKLSSISATLVNLGFATGYFITFAWGAISLSEGVITYGAMLAFIQLVGQIQGPLRTITRFIPVFITSFTATERLLELEALQPDAPAAPLPTPQGPIGIKGQRITYQYTSESRYIFRNFDFHIPSASIAAIVGETGAGKTTLIRLLLSLCRQQEGTLQLLLPGGQTLPITAAQRSAFAYVPQGNTLFSGTIRSNLLLGNPRATEAAMRQALHDASADFVLSNPQGLDARCGESGDGLSEGQAQRIAIARALLSPAPILLFDEATSSLDEATERLLLQRIVSRPTHQTLIFITHRPEVLQYADQIIHLERSQST